MIHAIDLWIIPLTLLFAIILFPVTRSISNLVTRLGTYHKNEKILTRIRKLYYTYLLLSVSISATVFILLYQNIGSTADIYNIILLSISASFMIPLLGRICSLSKDSPPFDNEWDREREHILSFMFSMTIGALIVAVLLFLYQVEFNNVPFNIRFVGDYKSLFIMFGVIVTTPIINAVIGENILRFTGIDEALKK